MSCPAGSGGSRRQHRQHWLEEVNALDAAAIAARWGAEKGSLLYSDFMNLEPTIPADQDIDITDIQFVFGRFGSTCGNPHPDQDPVNPKA